MDEILRAFGITVVSESDYCTAPLHTRAKACLARIFRERGPDHFTFLCRVIAETSEANRLAMSAHILGALSDVFAAHQGLMTFSTLDAFDSIDLLEVEARAAALCGSDRLAPKRAIVAVLLAGMLVGEEERAAA